MKQERNRNNSARGNFFLRLPPQHDLRSRHSDCAAKEVEAVSLHHALQLLAIASTHLFHFNQTPLKSHVHWIFPFVLFWSCQNFILVVSNFSLTSKTTNFHRPKEMFETSDVDQILNWELVQHSRAS